MAAARINLLFEQGATFDETWTWRQGGALVDLTSCTAKLQVRKRLTDESFVLEATSAAGQILLGGAAGTVRLLLSAAVTRALAAGSYVYDLEVYFPGGKELRFSKGRVRVDPEVTR